MLKGTNACIAFGPSGRPRLELPRRIDVSLKFSFPPILSFPNHQLVECAMPVVSDRRREQASQTVISRDGKTGQTLLLYLEPGQAEHPGGGRQAKEGLRNPSHLNQRRSGPGFSQSWREFFLPQGTTGHSAERVGTISTNAWIGPLLSRNRHDGDLRLRARLGPRKFVALHIRPLTPRHTDGGLYSTRRSK